jgi:hypothetical protein
MAARPRPVTATVTKPPWMRVPNADAAMYRRSSLSSNGSTASLTSVLDHDSYASESELQEEPIVDNTEEHGSDDAKNKPTVQFTTIHTAKPRYLVLIVTF